MLQSFSLVSTFEQTRGVERVLHNAMHSPPSLLSLMISQMSSLDACFATSEAEYSVVAVIVDLSSKQI
jgi:hypothetical protein